MKPFIHINAGSVEEAVELLAKYEGKAKLNAGGTDLLGVLKDRILSQYPETIINIKTIPGLSAIKEHEGGVSVGALTTLAEIIKSPIIEKYYPLLNEAARIPDSNRRPSAQSLPGYPLLALSLSDKSGMIDCFQGQVCSMPPARRPRRHGRRVFCVILNGGATSQLVWR